MNAYEYFFIRKKMRVMKCGKCGSENYVKAGFARGNQRYKCKNCGRQFTQTTDKNAAKRAAALYLYAIGFSMNTIAQMLGVTPATVLYWMRNFALRVYEEPSADDDFGTDLDEIWRFLGARKLNFGGGRRFAALPINAAALLAMQDEAQM
jgi:transposase